ncbi:hypothetical protein ACFY4C_39045 [Actinomadura viridis]|uniref:hypothetical protein n=1 Tax=Actinomadura viridis TaxID=58110 RepID=UPI0036B101BA
MSEADVEEIKAGLRDEFGGQGWLIVYSSKGRWWAFRGPLTRETFNATGDVEADCPEELRARLREIMAR